MGSHNGTKLFGCDCTITIFIEKGEGLFEFSNLFFGKVVCHGDLMDYAFQYVETHPLMLEYYYPYTAKDGTC